MDIFDYSSNEIAASPEFPEKFLKSSELFILCRTHEVSILQGVFGFDDSTVIECTDLDESVRYTNFDGYDFISMVHIEMLEKDFILREINLYISSKYLVLVMPEHNSPRLSAMEKKILSYAKNTEGREGRICGIYFEIFHNLLADFFDTLEILEGRMQALSDEIVANANRDQIVSINELRSMAYTAKKQLRALSYIGEQILLDENNLISKKQLQYFRNLNTRLKKLYDFAESLYNFSGEMLFTYDSRLSIKTNDTVNKLTILTLFFGPLTVITGIYGMNFDFMPELHLPFGYPLALGSMAVISLVLFLILKKMKWL